LVCDVGVRADVLHAPHFARALSQSYQTHKTPAQQWWRASYFSSRPRNHRGWHRSSSTG
jgi:hypothetical protein